MATTGIDPEANKLKQCLNEIRTKFLAVQKVTWDLAGDEVGIEFDVAITTEQERINLNHDVELGRLMRRISKICLKNRIPSFTYHDGEFIYEKRK